MGESLPIRTSMSGIMRNIWWGGGIDASTRVQIMNKEHYFGPIVGIYTHDLFYDSMASINDASLVVYDARIHRDKSPNPGARETIGVWNVNGVTVFYRSYSRTHLSPKRLNEFAMVFLDGEEHKIEQLEKLLINTETSEETT